MMNEKELNAELLKAELHLEDLNKLSMSENVNPLELPEIDMEIEAVKDWIDSLYNDLYEIQDGQPYDMAYDPTYYARFGVTIRG